MKTGGKALQETLKKNRDKIKPNEMIDTYNHSINGGGISYCLTCGVDFRNHLYVIVKDDRQKTTRKGS